MIIYVAIDKTEKATYFSLIDDENPKEWVENHLDLSNEPYEVMVIEDYVAKLHDRIEEAYNDGENDGYDSGMDNGYFIYTARRNQ